MSFAYLPWYTGDYRRDTAHLSCSEHGIFLLFLAHCWDQRGPLPLDERKLVGVCNARSTDEVEAMRRVLSEYFVQMEDGWYNRRIQKEIERASNISELRSKAGTLGYQAKAKHLLSKSQANASRSGQAIQGKVNTIRGLRSTELSKNPTAEARASRLPGDWKLPEDWKTWALACQPTWDEGRCNLAAAGFRDYWIAKAGRDGTKLDWLATWRNWVRREGAAKRPPALAQARTSDGKFE
jgi:uncharacterized protein YdaU (DUF1376 family)